MVELHTVDSFADAARRMYAHDPQRTRYSAKYRPSDAVTTLKVTNGPITLTCKVRRKNDMDAVERLSSDLLLGMSQWSPETVDEAEASAAATKVSEKDSTASNTAKKPDPKKQPDSKKQAKRGRGK
eukprot:PhM_4_TR1872/c0_g1_i1/m.58054/K03109/SRP9; signal recognition particle subunit SRP9